MANRGSTNYVDKHVLCPYYRRLDKEKNQIVCEGVDGAMNTRLVFQEVEDRKKYMRARCTSDYCLCAVCRGIHEFYEGD